MADYQDANQNWDPLQAQSEGKVCATCIYGIGPFTIGGRSAHGQPILTALIACNNTQSSKYMLMSTQVGSCQQWEQKSAESNQPKILVAHKAVPKLNIGGAK